MYDQNIDGTNFTKQQTTYSKPDSYPKVQKINILEPKNYANKFEKQILKIHVKKSFARITYKAVIDIFIGYKR